MLNPLVFIKDYALKSKIDKSKTSDFIKRAKEVQHTYNIDDNWLQFVKSNSKSSPFNFLLASTSLFTNFYQLVNTFRQKWTISYCWMEFPGEFNDYLTNFVPSVSNGRQFCFDLNNSQKTIGFSLFGAGNDSCQNSLFTIFTVASLLNFILFALVIHRIFIYSKYCVLMVGIQAKILRIFGLWDLFWIFYLTVNIVLSGLVKLALLDTSCVFTSVDGDSVFMNVFLQNQTFLKVFMEYCAVHGCFALLLYKYYSAPIEIYFKPQKFFDYVIERNQLVVKMNYQIDNTEAIDYIRYYFSNYKKEETKVVLIAIMEHLLEEKLVSEYKKKEEKT